MNPPVSGNAEISDDLLKKIKALLRKSDTASGVTPEEAALFAAKAQELMFKYNLDMATITAYVNGKSDFDADIKAMSFEKDRLGHYVWWRHLMTAIIHYNFCREVELTNQTGKYFGSTIIGQKHNIEFVHYLYGYLRSTIYEMAQDAWDQEKEKAEVWNMPLPHPWGFHSSFCRGAVAVVNRRLRDQFNASQNASIDAMALVVMSKDMLDKAIGEMFADLLPAKAKKSRPKNWAAYVAGNAAGEKLPLNRPLEDASKGKGLLH